MSVSCANSEDILYLNLFRVMIKCRLPFSEFKLLSEWLGVYTYIPPTQRMLAITPYLPIIAPIDCIILFKYCDTLNSCFNLNLQRMLATKHPTEFTFVEAYYGNQ